MTAERSRPSVEGPSTVKGWIASSTVTAAIVRSSGCGLRTWMRTSPGANSTRRTSNVSAAGGLSPTSPVIEPPDDTKSPAIATSRTIGTRARRR